MHKGDQEVCGPGWEFVFLGTYIKGSAGAVFLYSALLGEFAG